MKDQRKKSPAAPNPKTPRKDNSGMKMSGKSGQGMDNKFPQSKRQLGDRLK